VDECVKGDEIPQTDHVALHCEPLAFEVKPDGTRGGLKIDAFRADEDGISVYWVEHEPGPFEECVERTCCLLASLRTVRRNHGFGILKVGEIIQTAAAGNRVVTVVHDPIDEPEPNPAHSLIKGCIPGDDLLSDFRLLVDVRPFTEAALKIAKERERERRR
jgi:hypothetical protein